MAGKSISKGAMWILMGLLIIGLGGFGITNLGGRVQSIGSVGTAEIDVQTYARALRNEIEALAAERGESISMAEAEAAGLDRRVLSRLVSQAALEHEAHVLGISVGDETLRDEIVSIQAFQGAGGGFDRESYRFALEQAGLNEAEFEASIRAETAASLVQDAALSGVSAPEAQVDTLLSYLGERRSLAFAMLDRGDLRTGLPAPTEEELRAYHQSHLPEFTTPETRQITYVRVTPEMLVDTVEVDEAALRAAYEEREAEFNTPERRLVERLVFSDEAAARDAMARIEAGEDFETLVTERGLDMADVDLGDVSAADLGPAADAVFDTPAGEVTGPVETDLGPALFRVNAVLAARTTPFEEAVPQLRETLAAGPETAPAGVVARAQALRPEQKKALRPQLKAQQATARKEGSWFGHMLAGWLRPAVPAFAAVALVLACAGAFELGRYQGEQMDATQSAEVTESDVPVDLLMDGLL
jgi:peptidyl-prolyl cis-trans isomerase D